MGAGVTFVAVTGWLTTTAHLQAPESFQWRPVMLLLLLLLVMAGLLSPHEQAADAVACNMQLLQVWQGALQHSHLHGQHTAHGSDGRRLSAPARSTKHVCAMLQHGAGIASHETQPIPAAM